MMVVGLGAAAYCSMGKSLRWKGSQRRSARGEKGDDRYLLVRKLRPKRRTCFYGKFHLYSLRTCYQKSHLTLRCLKLIWCNNCMSSENCEKQKRRKMIQWTMFSRQKGNWKSLYETNLSLANIFGLDWPRFEACPLACLPIWPL